jgi:hypothetical protein
MSSTLSRTLTHSLKPLLRAEDNKFDLIDMRRHNVIEHDASFTRLDFRQGDNYTFQRDMFDAMLADAHGGPVTVRSLARTYKRRNQESREAGAERLGIKLSCVNLVQTVSLLNTAKTGGELSRELINEFYVEEKVPEVVLRNEEKRTLAGLLGKTVMLVWCILT